ncbi:MAG: hypothetical protein KA536_21960 [Saprospiraceae bacterium]|nr:hypothetical protein [Saprospiraceae bacterium]
MDETKIIITIKCGVLQSVVSNKEIKYMLIDHDNIERGDEFPGEDDYYSQDVLVDDIYIHYKYLDQEHSKQQV